MHRTSRRRRSYCSGCRRAGREATEMRIRRRYVAFALIAASVATLSAQRRQFFSGDIPVEGNPSYDGRLTFTRLRYPGYGGMTNEGPGWMHDYPDGERHLMKILSEISD